MPTLILVTDHPASRTEGWSRVEINGDALSLLASRAGAGLIVVQSSQPTAIRTASNGRASLRPGWDGTLGYSRYTLELTVDAPGPVRVDFDFTPIPAAPVATTPAQIEAFEQSLANRASKFPEDRAAFSGWQETYRARLGAWLMGGATPVRRTGAVETTERHEMGAFRVERIKYTSRPGRTTEALLSTPADGVRAPLLVALHGHEAGWGAAELEAFTAGHSDDFCGYFAARRWAVLQPATMDHRLMTPGWTLQGEWTHDAMSALDHVIADPRIDPSRLAVCGLSTGAHLAMNVLALDRRVRAGVVGCVFSTWHHVRTRLRIPPHCDCGVTAQLSDKIEQCDWAALAAPKPVQFQYGMKDACFTPGAAESGLNLEWNSGTFPRREFDAAFNEVRRAWAVAGRPADVSLVFHDGDHKVDNESAFAWLAGQVG